MQFKIPQDVQREDHIVGPLTMRQLIICGIGFSIAYGLFSIIGRDYHWISALIPVIPIVLIVVIFAFVKPLDMNFEKYLLYALEYYIILPKKRYWLKGTGDPSRLSYEPMASKKQTTQEEDIEEVVAPTKSIDELSSILDSNNQN